MSGTLSLPYFSWNDAVIAAAIPCNDQTIPFTSVSCGNGVHRIVAPTLAVSQNTIDPLRDNEFYADTISVSEPLKLPGKRLRLFCRQLLANANTLSIDVSANAAGAAPSPPPDQTSPDTPGASGKNGAAAGSEGRVAGAIELYFNAYAGNLDLSARGGDGEPGQTGGKGGPGGATPQMTDDYQCSSKLGPGDFPGNPGRQGKSGARGGQAGSGGAGSAGGSIRIVTATSNVAYTNPPDVSGGRHGAPGAPGNGGDAGAGGLGSFAWKAWVQH